MPNWYAKKEKNIFNLDAVFNEIEPLLVDVQANRESLATLIMAIGTYETFLKHPRYDGHAWHLQNFIQAVVAKESDEKARLHFAKLRKVVRPVANDTPFKKRDHVYIERTEHGWGCGYTGIVDAVFEDKNGIWSYRVMLDEEHGGHEVLVDHTRDMHRYNG